jgi:hypothetical protein
MSRTRAGCPGLNSSPLTLFSGKKNFSKDNVPFQPLQQQIIRLTIPEVYPSGENTPASQRFYFPAFNQPELNSQSFSFNSNSTYHHLISSSPLFSLNSGNLFNSSVDLAQSFENQLCVSPSFCQMVDRLVSYERAIYEAQRRLLDLERKVGILIEHAIVDQLLTIHQQVHTPPVLTSSPQPNDIPTGQGMMSPGAGIGLDIPGWNGPRMPVTPTQTWSTGSLDIPMQFAEHLVGPPGRNIDSNLHEKRRSVLGLLPHDSTTVRLQQLLFINPC